MVSCSVALPQAEKHFSVQSNAVYLGRYLIEETEYHFWSCTINMMNPSSEDVQILDCAADVIDVKGIVTKVPSVRGIVDRVVKKNEAFEYVAGVHLGGVSGVFRSWYEVKFIRSGSVVWVDGDFCSVDTLSLGGFH